MGLISSLLTGLRTHLESSLPGVPEVTIYKGKLTSEAVLQISTMPRALHVAFLGAEPVKRASGQADYGVTFGVFTLTDGPDAATDGLDLMEQAAAALVDYFPAAGGAVREAALGNIEPIDADSDVRRQMQLWGLTWGVRALIGEQAFAADDDPVPEANLVPTRLNGVTLEEGGHDLG